MIRLRKEDEDGDVSEKTLSEAKRLLRDLNTKLTAQPIEDEDDQKAAMKFMNAANALVGLLDKPDIRPAIVELRKVKDTSLGNLLGFMHAYNLRFGAATTLKEKQALPAALRYPGSNARPDPERGQARCHASNTR